MRTRLLFVDDEPLVLQGLRRALYAMREEWDMSFVESGPAALEVLAQDRYDVIITDMRMPGMDGAELLDEVKRRHPDMLRIILSGQSSREAVLRSISPSHQYLTKPCDVKELKQRLNEAFSMRDLLANQKLKTLVSSLKSIPSVPTLYEELLHELRGEDPSAARIGAVISKDIGMTAKILQLANSAFLGLRCHISSPTQAVGMIGMDMVRALVLSVDVFSRLEGRFEVGHYWMALWEHSVMVASFAQRITASENSSKAIVDESFTAGLLHDVGRVLLLAEMPEYVEILDEAAGKPGSLSTLEHARLGCTHSDVGAYLMGVWGLPHAVLQAVAFHDRPRQSTQKQFSSLTSVHAADAFAGALAPSIVTEDGGVDMEYLTGLGLADRAPAWRQACEEFLESSKRNAP